MEEIRLNGFYDNKSYKATYITFGANFVFMASWIQVQYE